jgi:hydrogenase nickel incorporation protein HypB
LAIITKMDLADAVNFDHRSARANTDSVRPGMQIVEVSAKTGAGMDQWLEALNRRCEKIPCLL